MLPWYVAAVVVALGGRYVLALVLQGIAFLIAVPLAWWAGKRLRIEEA